MRAAPAAGGRVTVSLRENWPSLHYATFVVDSQYVLLVDQWAADSATRNPLRNLPVSDIAAIYSLKEKSLPESWRTCPGVPVMLILTQSKRWRPPAPAASKPSE